ncbi:MAG: hypothetical protein GC192_04765 [Bacteroidetes bacterium]|nr:hypothetical protein [Bacteroidota bacterium]
MKKSIVLPIAIFTVIFLFGTSCQKDDNLVETVDATTTTATKSFPKADKALWTYLQNFEVEAANRSITINLNSTDLTAKIAEITEENVAGSCTYGGHAGHDIIIDKGFWNSTNSVYYKEMVVFHELGHCILGRGHLETAFQNNTCKSIMRSGIEGCLDNYNATTREYYLDELFSTVQP